MQSLEGRTYLVTGGTGFLGTAVVRRLLAAGASVHVTWFEEKELDRFEMADQVTTHRVDLADESAVETLYSSFEELDGSLHIAGGFAMAPVADTSLEDFTSMMRLNAETCFLCCREAVRALRRTGGGGRLVNVIARPSLEPCGGMLAYSTSKAAVASLTQCLAQEVKDEGILVNAVAPSLMDTAANRAAMPDADFSTWPKVEEVAEAMCFLASPENALTTGNLMPVYGKV